jgi:hypothetical protein
MSEEARQGFLDYLSRPTRPWFVTRRLSTSEVLEALGAPSEGAVFLASPKL